MRTAPGARGPLQLLEDNVSAIAFALVMALLLRHFCVEVFKIPTSSMYPTLRGDEGDGESRRPGDRIVVDKNAYVASGPERWDVPVFRFPLDRSRNFIKRIVLLPGEEGRMERGDVWVRPAGSAEPFRVARKPRDVRETLYVPVYPPVGPTPPDPLVFTTYGSPDVGPRLDAALAADAPARAASLAAIEAEFGLAAFRDVRTRLDATPRTHPARADIEALDAGLAERAALREYWRPSEGAARAWRIERFRRFAFGGGARESVEYAFPITDSVHAEDSPRSTYGSAAVDARVRLTVEPREGAELEVTWRPGDGRFATLTLGTDAARPSRLRTATRESPIAARLAPGRPTRVELEYVDGDARAWVDGEELVVLPDDLPIEQAIASTDPASDPQRLRITAEGGALVVRDVAVDRDLYYLSGHDEPQNRPASGESIVVPEDGFFVLGDNTRHSHDSRRWTAVGVELEDGRTVWWNSQEGPKSDYRGGEERKRVVDVDGVERTWLASQERATPASRRVLFVTRDMLVGRAFFALVFWPPKQVPARFRLIH